MNGLSTQQLTLGTSVLTTSGNALLVNGVLVSGANISTGQLTGTFYPLLSNPSGYITTGQTGSFGGGSTPTGNLTGVFYPLLNNPSGFILPSQTGAFASVINLGVTGNTLQLEINSLNSWTGGSDTLYYPLGTNPSNYITSSQTGIFTSVTVTGGLVQSYANLSGISGILVSTGISGLVLFNGLNLVQTSQTGAFITTGQTGAFYPLNSNPDNYITSAQTGNFITTNQTGSYSSAFYPRNSNPSGYITTGQTGAFGGGSTNTGILTGVFYPLLNNPSGFILPSQTGAFASAINLGITGNTLQLEINSLNSWTGGSTGLYYPLNSNPSGYVTAGQVSGTYFPSVNYSTVINWSSGNSFYTTLTGNTIFSFTGSQDGQSIAVFVKNTGTNGFTGAWPSTLRWPGQVLPVQTSGNFVDIYTLVNLTGVIFGSYIQGF